MLTTALVITHDDDTARGRDMVGLLEQSLASAGYRMEVRSVVAGDALPRPEDAAAVIPLGSEASAYDDALPWLASELAYLRAADRAGVPVLGICFGAQLLARALGGSVEPGESPEVGLLEIDTDVPDLLPAGPWVSSHYDVIVPPTGARTIARTATAVQAFVHGRHVGLQFHPETTSAVLRAWDGRRTASLPQGDRQLSTWLDLAVVAEELDATAEQRQAMCSQIVQAFALGEYAALSDAKGLVADARGGVTRR